MRPPDLLQRFAELRAAQPGVRTREAAEQLGVSECELVAARCGTPDCIRLDGDWTALLLGLAALGPIQALTRNDSAVMEKIGAYAPVTIDGEAARVAGDDIDLRIDLAMWRHAFATIDPIRRVTRRSIQVFGADGTAVHKIHEAARTNVTAFATLVTAHASASQAAGEAVPPTRAAAQRAADMRLVDGQAFCAVLEWAAARRTDVQLGVASHGTEQVHHGPIERIERYGPWFNVMDTDLSLHLLEGNIRASGLAIRDQREAVVALDAQAQAVAWVSSAESGWTSLLQGL